MNHGGAYPARGPPIPPNQSPSSQRLNELLDNIRSEFDQEAMRSENAEQQSKSISEKARGSNCLRCTPCLSYPIQLEPIV